MKLVKIFVVFLFLFVSSQVDDMRNSIDRSNDIIIFILNGLPNLLSMLVCSVFVSLFAQPEKRVEYTHGVFVGLLIYECMQLWMPGKTFDYFDLFFTFIGWVIVLVVYRLRMSSELPSNQSKIKE
jgi:hypothetical protein